jgi:hypothetical protein
MKQYLLTVYQPDGPPPADIDFDAMGVRLTALNEEMQAAGAWVFTGPLHPASTATVVRVKEGEALMTDGPYLEGKEHVGGLTILQAPDLDAAVEWARRLGEITMLPIEVRPFVTGVAGTEELGDPEGA